MPYGTLEYMYTRQNMAFSLEFFACFVRFVDFALNLEPPWSLPCPVALYYLMEISQDNRIALANSRHCSESGRNFDRRTGRHVTTSPQSKTVSSRPEKNFKHN